MRGHHLVLPLITLLGAVSAVDPDPTTTGSAGTDSFYVDVASGTKAGRDDVGDAPAHSTSSASPAIIIGSQTCAAADHVAQAPGSATSVTFCPGTAPTPTPTLTLAHIRHAFAELPLPTADLVVQPPDGLTLVNFATNFYTPTSAPITRTVTLLGQQVTIRATPSTYTWRYGDGTTRTTTDPGAAYPHLRITHRYERTGRYRPSLAITYTGTYRLGGTNGPNDASGPGSPGPWRPIPGTVTRQGAPQALRAVEATPTLVGY